MKHIKIEIAATEIQQDELIALLDEYNTTGFEQTDSMLIAYFKEDSFVQPETIKVLEGYEFALSEVQERNWNQEWERNFQPVVVDDFCAVRADFHPPILDVQHEIIITPKMSFGTGHHATTYMMMQQMRDIDFKNKTVFDFGTGTGILSILARKLGAASVAAIDVDEWSIENAKENVESNHCSGIDLQLSTTIPSIQFDIILANINRNVILQYMAYLKEASRHGGHVLFSGLMVQDKDAIVASATNCEFKLQKNIERQGWISLLFMNSL